MSNTRKKEYKQEAMALVQQSNQSIAAVAHNLGINDGVLRRWIKEFSEPHQKVFPGQSNPKDEEIARLRRELAQVKKERVFL